jgi:uncharacterized protein (TIGR02391 family)
MSLSGNIDERLWSAVQSAYESGNYSAAILDSVFYLSELIRNKSGLDTDGNSLVGSAFGGQNPIIKVNSLHTESERDEQRGVEQLLRGIYTAIRNPRSHDKRTDSVEIADILITFIGWICGLIDKSRSPFDTQQFIAAVFDKHFAQNERYADLLVNRIPKRKQLEILIEIFHRRTEGTPKCISLFTQAVLKALSPEEQEQFWQVVSDSLENASADAEFRSIIQIVQKDWTKISEFARLRTEHRLVESIKEGEYDSSRKMCPKGALGTWTTSIGDEFILKDDLVSAIIGRLSSDKPEARAYGFQYFFNLLRDLRSAPPIGLIWNLKKRLKDEHDQEVFDALSWVTDEIFADDGDEWIKAFREPIEQFSLVASTGITEDDIPF